MHSLGLLTVFDDKYVMKINKESFEDLSIIVTTGSGTIIKMGSSRDITNYLNIYLESMKSLNGDTSDIVKINMSAKYQDAFSKDSICSLVNFLSNNTDEDLFKSIMLMDNIGLMKYIQYLQEVGW